MNIELGVYEGKSINYLSNHTDEIIYGFDSFDGLNEDWVGGYLDHSSGFYKTKIPKTNKNVLLINGLIQNTLENFLLKQNKKIKFVHFDLDTYESTKYALQIIKPYLCEGSVLLFDEFYNFPGYRSGEFKAFYEIFHENEFQYVAFNVKGPQVTIIYNERK